MDWRKVNQPSQLSFGWLSQIFFAVCFGPVKCRMLQQLSRVRKYFMPRILPKVKPAWQSSGASQSASRASRHQSRSSNWDAASERKVSGTDFVLHHAQTVRQKTQFGMMGACAFLSWFSLIFKAHTILWCSSTYFFEWFGSLETGKTKKFL